MKHATQTLSATLPDEFIITKLTNTLYELTYNENTESVEVAPAEDEETATQYQYDTYTRQSGRVCRKLCGIPV